MEGAMDCQKCRGLMMIDLAYDTLDHATIWGLHCIPCGKCH